MNADRELGMPADTWPSHDERASRADLWESSADERERLADERERLADEREALADARERMADRHDGELDRREAEPAVDSSARAMDAAAEAAAALAAVRRAEDAMRRAEAQLSRARLASDRIEAHANRLAAEELRVTAAEGERDSVGEERSWRADRRDFVAVERDRLADDRDVLADERDESASARERLADQREWDALTRERHLDGSGTERRRALESPVLDESTRDAQRRTERQRDHDAASRRTAATDRARAAASWRPRAYGPKLLASFADLATELIVSDDLSDVLPRILKYTVAALDGCDHASVSLWRGGQAVETVATSPIATELDDLAFGTDLGPGPETLRSASPLYVPDLGTSRRWPVFAATAGQLGVASVLCMGLFVHQRAHWTPLGALTLYGTTAAAFTEEDEEFASILAAYVSVAVAIAHQRGEVDRREAALHRGLSTRDVIGQAKGILMERRHLSAPDAFDVLRRASQRLNLKVADIARHLAETGELPS